MPQHIRVGPSLWTLCPVPSCAFRTLLCVLLSILKKRKKRKPKDSPELLIFYSFLFSFYFLTPRYTWPSSLEHHHRRSKRHRETQRPSIFSPCSIWGSDYSLVTETPSSQDFLAPQTSLIPPFSVQTSFPNFFRELLCFPALSHWHSPILAHSFGLY